MITNCTAEEIASKLVAREFSVLAEGSLESVLAQEVARKVHNHKTLYEPLLLGTASMPRRWYDWNIGFLVPQLDLEHVCVLLDRHRQALSKSEGIAWGLGEAGSDDPRIIDFLFHVCESCEDYDAWWCAADALEKLGQASQIDIKKRTLKGKEWFDLNHCLENLSERPAIIGVLRRATLDNTESQIVPRCREALNSSVHKVVQNALSILERLRVDDDATLASLLMLYENSIDNSTSLRPRIVEALGQIASPKVRNLLEAALLDAAYYRTRAYAANGLGKIGDARSLDILYKALIKENDFSVISYISDAIYSIRLKEKNLIAQLLNTNKWPENGMIVDQTNKWYTHPEIYDRFSSAEDPLGVTLDFALSLIPTGAQVIADLGTGTGRLAIHAAMNRPDIALIYAVDANGPMHSWLVDRLKPAGGHLTAIKPVKARIAKLPFDDESVDAVLSSWAFPSNWFDQNVCLSELKEVRRVLKPTGKLITIGWDENFRDQLSELWYRFVPEPEFRRESIEDWRRRRRSKLLSPRNCHLTFVKRNFQVPLLFNTPADAASVIGYLFGYSAGTWVSRQQRCEFSIAVGITEDNRDSIDRAISTVMADLRTTP